MALTIQKVFDANVYINNVSKHGQASEITCPQVNYMMNDYTALGMIGTLPLFNGIEAMEATFKWTYLDNDAQMDMSDPFQAVEIMVRSSKAIYENGGLVEEQPIVIFMRGTGKQHQGGTFASKTDVETESVLAVNYYKLEIDGEEIIEIDVISNIFKINGEDMLAERRANLGI